MDTVARVMTLRTMMPGLDLRPKVDFLHFTFKGERNGYTARFVGGFTARSLILTNEITMAKRSVTEADLDRPLTTIGCELKPSLIGRLRAKVEGLYHFLRSEWHQLFRTL